MSQNTRQAWQAHLAENNQGERNYTPYNLQNILSNTAKEAGKNTAIIFHNFRSEF